ncbi:N-acetyl sugar amidotransferase [Magnetovibrio sp. PR-2]|uniref:N-acetyl sugar amidotransferase n=1 Tax=Magnetovibrio sp. PR-2 TaxID=3120356 RepID=UPI002FCE1C44
MRYCKKCLEPDTRPDCQFDDEGVCFPCRYQENMPSIDWDQRRREMEEIADWGKCHNSSGYDCIIPVSGGKDSHRQVIIAREEFGLKPLLVSLACPPEQFTERGANNLANLTSLGCDTYTVSPAPQTWKKLMRFCFFKYGNLSKANELAIYVSAPKIASFFSIPLILYGENPALSWGSSGGSLDGNANQTKSTNTLQNGDISMYLKAGFTEQELYWYTFPTNGQIERANLRMIYLGYYIPDFNDTVNGRVAIEHGLEPRTGFDARPENIGQINPFDALDSDFVPVNQHLKYIKLGFGRASEQITSLVRSKQIDREEGIELARKYDGRCSTKYIEQFCDYLEISQEDFWEVAEKYRNHDLWERKGNDWVLKYPLR